MVDARQVTQVEDVVELGRRGGQLVHHSPVPIHEHVFAVSWLGEMAPLGRWTCDREVVGSTPGLVAIKWLVPGWATVCGQVNHLSI